MWSEGACNCKRNLTRYAIVCAAYICSLFFMLTLCHSPRLCFSNIAFFRCISYHVHVSLNTYFLCHLSVIISCSACSIQRHMGCAYGHCKDLRLFFVCHVS